MSHKTDKDLLNEVLAHLKDYLALTAYHYGLTDDAVTLKTKQIIKDIETNLDLKGVSH